MVYEWMMKQQNHLILLKVISNSIVGLIIFYLTIQQ